MMNEMEKVVLVAIEDQTETRMIRVTNYTAIEEKMTDTTNATPLEIELSITTFFTGKHMA